MTKFSQSVLSLLALPQVGAIRTKISNILSPQEIEKYCAVKLLQEKIKDVDFFKSSKTAVNRGVLQLEYKICPDDAMSNFKKNHNRLDVATMLKKLDEEAKKKGPKQAKEDVKLLKKNKMLRSSRRIVGTGAIVSLRGDYDSKIMEFRITKWGKILNIDDKNLVQKLTESTEESVQLGGCWVFVKIEFTWSVRCHLESTGDIELGRLDVVRKSGKLVLKPHLTRDMAGALYAARTLKGWDYPMYALATVHGVKPLLHALSPLQHMVQANYVPLRVFSVPRMVDLALEREWMTEQKRLVGLES